MAIKKVTVSGFFPELPAGHAYQESRGSGGSVVVAIKRAVDELFDKPMVKNRRIHTLKLTVAVLE